MSAVLLGTALAGCGPSDADAGPADDEPPELTEVIAMFGEPHPAALDISGADVKRVIPEATPVTFRVSASDDQTQADDLRVELADPDTLDPIAIDDANYDNGLWRLTGSGVPGIALTVSVEDAAGNRATWPHAVRFPARSDALRRSWTILAYDAAGTVVGRQTARWEDGT